jgi:hypothetical protein
MQTDCFQHLLTLESAVGLQFDCFDLVIWILEEKAFCTFARTYVTSSTQRDDQNRFPHHAHRAANAVLSRSAGTHFNVEQVLLSPLPHVG